MGIFFCFVMVLYFVGLGLGDERDITVKGLEIVKNCDKIYLEMYTSILGIPKERLEAFYGKEVIEADRDLVEQGCTEMIELARKKCCISCCWRCFWCYYTY